MAPLSSRLDVRGFVCGVAGASIPALSFAIAPGACLALLGDRAAELSCLLDALAGHLPGLGGQILLDGRDVAALPAGHRGMGLFSARDPLFAHLTVRRNLAFPLEARGMARQAVAARVDAVLALLGLDGCAGCRPRGLAPPDDWRARLGRLLVFAPSVLLLDDPFAGLERVDRLAMRRLLARMARAQGLTMLLATGDREDALLLSESIGLLAGRVLLQTGGAAELFDRPDCEQVAIRFGDANALTGRVAWVENDLASIRLASGAQVEALAGHGLAGETLCTLCVRPDRIATLFSTGRAAAEDEGEGTLPAVLVELHHMGDHIRLRFRLEDGQEVLVRRPPAQTLTGLAPGQTARLAWQSEHAVAFPFRGEMG